MDAHDGERGPVVPLGQARPDTEWRCVGDPDTWEAAGNWFNCGASGVVSLLGLVPHSSVAEAVRGDDHGPVLVHLTVCKAHTRGARRWLRQKMHPQDDVMTVGTEVLMREWGQIVDPIQVPVLAPVRASA